MSKKITNVDGVSLPIAVWLAYDNYDYATDDSIISATSLMKPIKQIVFGRRYKDADKEIDVSDLLASSMGTALHDSVENAWKDKSKVVKILDEMGYINGSDIFDNVTFEKRSVLPVGKYKVSGKFDMVFQGIVADIKSTSVWTWIYGSKDDDYKIQMSIYRWLNPDLIKSDDAYVEFIFTDWSGVKAKQDSQYPQSRVASKKIKLMSVSETDHWIKQRLDLVELNEMNADDDLPDCTDEELWRSADTWKYYAGASRARATKNFDNSAEAIAFQASKGGKGDIVLVKGEIKRCSYCSFQEYCKQYAGFKVKGLVK